MLFEQVLIQQQIVLQHFEHFLVLQQNSYPYLNQKNTVLYYCHQSADDIQEALKDLLSGTMFVGTLRPYQKKIHNGWDSQQMQTVSFHHAFCRLLLKLSQFHAIIIINERSVYAKERSDMKTTEQQHNERKRELMEKVEDEYYLKSQMEVLKQGVALFVDKYKANQA